MRPSAERISTGGDPVKNLGLALESGASDSDKRILWEQARESLKPSGQQAEITLKSDTITDAQLSEVIAAMAEIMQSTTGNTLVITGSKSTLRFTSDLFEPVTDASFHALIESLRKFVADNPFGSFTLDVIRSYPQTQDTSLESTPITLRSVEKPSTLTDELRRAASVILKTALDRVLR